MDVYIENFATSDIIGHHPVPGPLPKGFPEMEEGAPGEEGPHEKEFWEEMGIGGTLRKKKAQGWRGAPPKKMRH